MIQRTSLLVLLLVGCFPGRPADPIDVRVRVGVVALDSHNVPVMVLEEEGGPRLLPIWIGMDAAHSISAEIENQKPPRPNTHDLAKRMIDGLDGEVARVVVTELRKGTYYAVMDLQTRNGTVEIDARPSDAIAIALRLNAPIFVRDPVFAEAGEMVIPDFERREEERLPKRRRRQPIGISPATPQRSL